MESKHIYVTTLVTPTIPTPKHEMDHPHFHSASNSADNDNTTYPISAEIENVAQQGPLFCFSEWKDDLSIHISISTHDRCQQGLMV